MGELNKHDIIRLKKTIVTLLRNVHTPILLLSDELLSQSMYDLNYSQHAELLSNLFPNAEIILFLRFQTTWLKSVYRQALQMGDVLAVKDFFRLDRDKILSDDNPKIDIYNNRITIDPFNLDLTDMVKTYQVKFGKEKTHIYFYENLKKNKDNCIKMLCKNIGLKPPNLTFNKSINRSYSALSCILTLKLYQVADVIDIRFLLQDTRVFYKYIVKKIRHTSFPLNSEITLLKISDDFLNWHLVKNTLTKKQIVKVFFKKTFRRTRFFSLWRFLMQNILDKVVYIDWDIFERDNIKEIFDQHFYAQNKQLSLLLSPKELPREYVKQK